MDQSLKTGLKKKKESVLGCHSKILPQGGAKGLLLSMTKFKGLSALQIQRDGDGDPTRIWCHYSEFYRLSLCFHYYHNHRFCTLRSNKRSKLTAGLSVRQGTRSESSPKPKTPQPQKRRCRREAAEQLFSTPSPPGGLDDPTALSPAAAVLPMGGQATSLPCPVFKCPFAVPRWK